MKYNPFNHHRRSLRLRGYDYHAARVYFVTICMKVGHCFLGQVVDGEMRVNAAGEMVLREWFTLMERFDHIVLDAFAIMPNHIHGIIQIEDLEAGVLEKEKATIRDEQADIALEQRATTRIASTGDEIEGRKSEIDAHDENEVNVGVPLVGTQNPVQKNQPSLGHIVGVFKSITTHRYIQGVREQEWSPFPGGLWQRNYYEHIIRNERALQAIRAYIDNNPANWPGDQYYPAV